VRKLKTQSDELTRNNSDLTNTRNRLNQENAELHRTIHDLENNCGSFSKTKSQLQIQLEETKARLEEESRVSLRPYCYIVCSLEVLSCIVMSVNWYIYL